MPGERQEGSGAAAQPLELLTGFEALLGAERDLCGDAVTRECGTAEGLALAGVRAASVGIGPTPGPDGCGLELAGTSCVHHVQGAALQHPGGAFELAAGSAQEAVDHSLVAHLLSARLGRAGLCSLSPALAGGLALVRRPGGADTLDGGPPAEPGAPTRRVVELARQACERAAERTGRALDVIGREGEAGAHVVLVAAGGEVERAREAARALTGAGVPAASLAVTLVRPFPEAEVREALREARSIFVLENAALGGALIDRVRAAVGDGPPVHALTPAAPAPLLSALAKQLPEGRPPEVELAGQVELPPPLERRLVAAPAGPWGDATARQLAAALGALGPVHVARHTRRHLGATVLAWSGPGGDGDVLLASHPAALGARGPLALVRPGADVVLLCGARDALEVARQLDSDARALLRERRLRAHWVAPPEAAEESEGAASLVLAGAALAALCGGGEPAERAARELATAGRDASARWLLHGAAHVAALDPDALEPSRHVEEVDFRPRRGLPRMPETVDDEEERERWSERIRRFHRTGRGAFGVPHLPVRPAVLRSLGPALRQSSAHPFALVPTDDPVRPLAARGLLELLVEACEALHEAGRGARTLTDNLERLGALAARLLASRAPGMALGDLVRGAGNELVRSLALQSDEEAILREDLGELAGRLPADAPVLDLRADTPLRLYLAAVEAVRGPIRRRFTAELEQLRERLRDLLELDRMATGSGRSAESLAAALGRSGEDYVDPAALSRTLARAASSEPLEPRRRERVEAALATIEAHLAGDADAPRVVLLRPPGLHLGSADAQQREHASPLVAAVGMFDGLASGMAGVFRAARTARLEASGSYRPELHDEPLATLDWQGFTADELALVPAIAAVTSGPRLRQWEQGAFSELLRSSRPVHVLVLDRVAAGDEAQDLSRFHIDLGYLSVAHREAFAVGSTLAHPGPLVAGLARAVQAVRPAVALVSLPGPEPLPWRARLAEAALQGRVCPDFQYDPDAGPSWAHRFSLDPNPQPERPWPLHRLAYLEGDEEKTLDLAFTFADAVALEPEYLRHLQTIPRVAWDDAQLPLAEYLERFDPAGHAPGIPYLWVTDEHETLQRAVVTRELAMACADRLRGWRVLQELAGYQNVFAERAAAAARDEALAEAEQRTGALELAHAEELDRVRREAVQESMERLASVLMSADGLPALAPISARAGEPAPPPPQPVPTAAEAAPTLEAEPPPEEVLEEEEPLSFDEPFVDSALCTTCNECTNLNAQLFQYNADKQAFIADPAAGSFAELVKAAELCPARCIHPGKPRSDDPTGTPEMIERAAAFNG